MARSDSPGSRRGHSHTRKGSATGAVPRNYKPPRDRAVPTKDAVDCPDCKATIGNRCVGADGIERDGCHRARRRMAVRAENEKRMSA
jgi:hypothetical protein